MAIAKAQASGVGIAVAHRSAHAGRIGAYGEQAARAGLIAIACVNVHGGGRLVAPFGGAERRLATNPIVFAAPTEDPERPFVLDLATSVGAEGKVRVARNRGVQLPPGWILDGAGRPSTEPWDLYGGDPPGSRTPGARCCPWAGRSAGALTRASCLSMAVELLAGALTPAGATRPDQGGGGRGNGICVVLAIDPERFVGLGPFEESLSALVEYVKQPPYAEGFDEVLTAGEPERRRRTERMASGIELDDATCRQVGAAAASVGSGRTRAPYATRPGSGRPARVRGVGQASVTCASAGASRDLRSLLHPDDLPCVVLQITDNCVARRRSTTAGTSRRRVARLDANHRRDLGVAHRSHGIAGIALRDAVSRAGDRAQ